MGKMTTDQLARYLNLSRSTVSKALNDHPSVAERTKKAVLKAAYQFGYMDYPVPEDPAKAENVHAVNGVICVLMTNEMVRNRFWNVILDGMEDFLLQNGFTIKKLLMDDRRASHLPNLRVPYEADGIVVLGSRTRQLYKQLLGYGLPMVTVDTSADTRGNNLLCDVVMMNNLSCTYEIAAHMIRSGRKNIAFVGDKFDSLSVWERWQGCQQALQEYGTIVRAFDTLLNIPLKGDTRSYVQRAFDEIGLLPDACICANDVVASYVFQTLAKMGLSVPKDVMISGFDSFDTATMSRNHSLALTSVAFDIREIGRQTARQMLYRLENPKVPYGIFSVESKVVYRSSTEAEAERMIMSKKYL